VAAGETAASLTVTAASTVDTTKSGTAAVTVTVPVTVTGVTVSPATASVIRGGTQAFTAEVAGTGSPAQTVTWSVGGNSSTETAISDAGVLAVAAGETAASLTVTAASTVDATKSGAASVTIPVPAVIRITITPARVSVVKGGTYTFSAEVVGTNNHDKTVTWSVSGKNSTGTAISAAGVLTVAADETATDFIVRATSTFNTSKFDTAAVTIKGEGSIILIYYPEDDEADDALSGLSDVTAATPVPLTALTVTGDPFDTYRWLVDGSIKDTTDTFTLNAGDYTPGPHQLSLEVTLNGAVYSKSGAFTVQ
jgi:hypothetical protein